MTYKFLVLSLVLGFVVVACSPNTVLQQPEVDGSNAMVQENDSEVVAEENTVEKMEDVADGDVVNISLDAFNFGYSQAEIKVKKDDKVKIVLTSTDGFHDWVVDEFDAATEQIKTGESSVVEFVADQAGEFEFYCSVGQHRALGMVGRLVVE